MPPSILPPGHSKSSWWSRTKSGKEPTVRPMRSFSNLNDDSEKSMLPVSAKSKDSSGSRFKTLGSAISFKSKKVASLAIQEPPSDVPIQPPPPPTPPADFDADQTTVAPSIIHSSNKLHGIKPIRTVRSTEADNDAKSARTASEPRTPSDYRTSYQPSVLTSFSEIDPFASSGVIVQQNHDPNRLSAYSDSSMLEPSKQRGEILFYNRISYASSSSKSQGHSSDSHSMKPASPRSSRFSRPEGSRQNPAGGVKDTSLAPPASPLTGPRRQSPSGSSGSTVRMGEGSRLSEPPPGKLSFQRTSPPSTSRSRGMTIGAPEGNDRRPSTANPPGPSAVPARLRKMSDLPSSSPKPFHSSSAVPSSSSPIAFSRSRSSTVNSAESFESPNMSPSSMARPLVVVRKASSTRVNLPPLSRAPSQDLPPTPFPESVHDASDSLDDLSLYPDADIPSSSSSSLSFAPSMDLDMDAIAGDMINQLMLHSFDDQVVSKSKGKGRASRRTAMSTSPSDTLRDFELVQPGPSSSTSRLPSAGGSGEGGSVDHGSGMFSMRSLKRASSQQSLLGKRFSGASISSITSGSISHEDALFGKSMSSGTKTPRKQRSFHHSRLPLPPIPALRHTTSDVASPASPVCPPIEQRKSSGSMHAPTRKRLFSGGSSARRSTSSHGQGAMSGDEDNRSIYSVDEQLRAAGQKIVMSFGSFANPLSLLTSNSCVAPGSYLPDAAAGMESTTSLPPEPQTPQTPTGMESSRRASQAEYIPQHIMSPAEMLKLEQQLAREAADKERRDGQADDRHGQTESGTPMSPGGRQTSIVSPATSAFGRDDPVHRQDNKTPVSSPQLKPAAFAQPPRATRLPFRSHSAQAQPPRKPSLTIRPSTATTAQQLVAASMEASSESPQQAPCSLPPPPRARPSPNGQAKKSENEKRLSTIPLQPLSPPPARLRGRVPSLPGSTSHVPAAATHRPAAVTHRPAQSSVSRPPSAFDQKALQRKSLMKKPSFLDIEDEADAASESLMDVKLDALDSPTMDSSFLDMERGKDSFDTVRSSDSLLYV